MEPLAKIRFWIAVVVSPLVVPLMVYATFVFMLGVDADNNQEIQTGISAATWSSYFLAFGFAVASYVFIRKKNWWSVWRFLMMGVASGFATWILFSIASQEFVSLLFYVFLSAGSLMGIGFWLIAFFQPDGKHLIPSSTTSRRRRRRSN